MVQMLLVIYHRIGPDQCSTLDCLGHETSRLVENCESEVAKNKQLLQPVDVISGTGRDMYTIGR